MAFQTPITITKALERIRKHEYVLPAIQREFVWSTDQICRLFDSLMRGYPIGSFLFWKVDKQHCTEYVFYDFIRDYHELHGSHCPQLNLEGAPGVVAILDGQQRLTALNVALRGSHSEKLPRKHRSNPDAYPQKRLYLNLCGSAEENELGLQFDFRFLSHERAQLNEERGEHWFEVPKILAFSKEDAGPLIFEYIQEAGLANNKTAYRTLDRLHAIVHRENFLNYYEEEAQDLDKVLNIFIRVNSGGTVLSYSDLLLSIATAQWQELDAREEIHGLVDELNSTGQGFAFDKDLVLKAGLVLTDTNDIRFKVTNFNASNMQKLQAQWTSIASSLRLAARLLADFGFSSSTLAANSVLIPIAYHLAKREAGSSFLSSKATRDERESIRLWTVRSLVKPGIWGSGLDTLLGALRSVLGENQEPQFPVAAMEATMARLGKALKFEEDEIQELLESSYTNRQTFALLSLLYPGFDFRNVFHIDHVMPRSLLRERSLRAAGLSEEDTAQVRICMDQLPNLQLLEGPINIQKQDSPPDDWAKAQYPDPIVRGLYVDRHQLEPLPHGSAEFLRFFNERREKQANKLRALLGVSESGAR